MLPSGREHEFTSKMQGAGFEPLQIKIALILFSFNNRINNFRAKYLRGEGDSNSFGIFPMLKKYLSIENAFGNRSNNHSKNRNCGGSYDLAMVTGIGSD